MALLEAALAGAVPDGTAGAAWLIEEIVNAVLLVLRSGQGGGSTRRGFRRGRRSTGWFLRAAQQLVLERLNHHLVMLDRAQRARAASPSAGVSTARARRERRRARSRGARRADRGQEKAPRPRGQRTITLVLDLRPASPGPNSGGPVSAWPSRHFGRLHREGLRRPDDTPGSGLAPAPPP